MGGFLRAKAVPTIAILAVALIAALPGFSQARKSLPHTVSPVASAIGGALPGLPEIVSRLTAVQLQNHQLGRAYTVVREYELLNRKQAQPSSVTAEVSIVPPDSKQYTIRSTQGGGSGEHLVRRVLDHEVEIAPAWRETALTEENYNFQLLGRENVDGYDCIVLGLVPRRESRDLIRGRAWIDAASFNIRRLVGSPAKNPSWWVKRLEITLDFSPIMGIWMQTAFTAHAEVRLFGEHFFVGREVQVRTAEGIAGPPDLAKANTAVEASTASRKQAATPRRAHPPKADQTSTAIIGAGVISLH